MVGAVGGGEIDGEFLINGAWMVGLGIKNFNVISLVSLSSG